MNYPERKSKTKHLSDDYFSKFYIIVKKFKNDKYQYHVKEMFWI